jgi:hypothetical protein
MSNLIIRILNPQGEILNVVTFHETGIKVDVTKRYRVDIRGRLEANTDAVDFAVEIEIPKPTESDS